MPRWLVASLIAFMLSCFGFAAAAHGSASAPDRDGAVPTHVVQHDLSASDASGHDTEDASALQDDVGSNCAEAATGEFRAFLAVSASQPVPQPAMTATPSPFLAQPKRPPRDRA
ncbi:hypothetical protein [Variovorax sp. GT1P44]|uniref:hypothetical protein n=1 Tax=Variovorax sp. GT1P44 TaxID=3443742 RepID=UPI003F455502